MNQYMRNGRHQIFIQQGELILLANLVVLDVGVVLAHDRVNLVCGLFRVADAQKGAGGGELGKPVDGGQLDHLGLRNHHFPSGGAGVPLRLHLQRALRDGAEHHLPGIPLPPLDGPRRALLYRGRSGSLLRRLPHRRTVPVKAKCVPASLLFVGGGGPGRISALPVRGRAADGGIPDPERADAGG